jgi:hypothetical protein
MLVNYQAGSGESVRGWEKNKNKARDANFQRMDNFN